MVLFIQSITDVSSYINSSAQKLKFLFYQSYYFSLCVQSYLSHFVPFSIVVVLPAQSISDQLIDQLQCPKIEIPILPKLLFFLQSYQFHFAQFSSLIVLRVSTPVPQIIRKFGEAMTPFSSFLQALARLFSTFVSLKTANCMIMFSIVRMAWCMTRKLEFATDPMMQRYCIVYSFFLHLQRYRVQYGKIKGQSY